MSEEEKDKSLASAKVVVKEAGFLIFQLILKQKSDEVSLAIDNVTEKPSVAVYLTKLDQTHTRSKGIPGWAPGPAGSHDAWASMVTAISRSFGYE